MNELLKYALENGMIDLSHIQEQKEMNERNEILNQYEESIWEASDGYYKIRIFDSSIKKKRMIKRRSRKDLEDAIIEIHMKSIENPTFMEVYEEWIDRRVELGKISISTKQRNQQVYNRHFKEFGKRSIKEMEPDELSSFLEEQISQEKLTAKAFSNLKSITKGTLRWAKRRKLIDWNIEELFYDLDISDREFKKIIKEDNEEVFTDEEMGRIIEYMKNNLDLLNLGLLLTFATGIRIGELSALKWEDWVYDKNGDSASIIKIRRTETRYYEDHVGIFTIKDFPKTAAGIRNVVLPSNCVWIIKRIREMTAFGEFMFVQDNERLHTYSFRNRLKTLCKKTGCVLKSPHKIRKTYCSILLDHSLDAQTVISQMGHTDITCSENFYHRDRKTLAKKQEIMDNIPELNIV